MADKIHYAQVERGNECTPHDEWSETACGLDIEGTDSLTNVSKEVTCKNCIRVINNRKQVNPNN